MDDKQDNKSTIMLIATTTFGLEAVVRREVEVLGFKGVTVSDGRIEFKALVEDIPRVNLRLRAADRVLLKLGEFKAADFDALFDRTEAIPWDRWVTEDGKITVVGKCVKSALASVRACQSIVKKAILRKLKEKYNKDWFEETGPEFTIQVSVLKDVAQITLDTSGWGLHKRGYRTVTGEVPLRENLAAALVLLSLWNKDQTLIDPMCGSGTILIEAAMIARNIAPGLKREFASEQWPAIDKKFWEEARLAAARAVNTDGALRIFGYDIDQNRIHDCRVNARKAGVEQDIVFECKDIKDLPTDQEDGVIVSNPPYGVKLSSARELAPVYGALYKIFRERRGRAFYILTADKKFPEHFRGVKPNKVRKLYNGTLEVNYYQYYGINKG